MILPLIMIMHEGLEPSLKEEMTNFSSFIKEFFLIKEVNLHISFYLTKVS